MDRGGSEGFVEGGGGSDEATLGEVKGPGVAGEGGGGSEGFELEGSKVLAEGESEVLVAEEGENSEMSDKVWDGG